MTTLTTLSNDQLVVQYKHLESARHFRAARVVFSELVERVGYHAAMRLLEAAK